LTRDRSEEQDRLTAVVRQFPQRRIVVVGDLVADQFLYGGISRVSREAPVLILKYEKTETTPGGAANCAVNVAALGAGVTLIGVIGKDDAGSALIDSLSRSRVDCQNLVVHPSHRTTTKVRILAGQLHSTRQQVLRIDYEGTHLDNQPVREQLITKVWEQSRGADAIIISDYDYGVVDASVAEAIRGVAAERAIPVIVDSRRRVAELRGFTSATPNEEEAEQLLDQQFESTTQLLDAGESLRTGLGYKALLVTRGSLGMILFEEGRDPVEIPAVGAREPVDVTGAGDTVIATYTLALASGSTFADAARLANHGGGIVVMKRGTASASRQELLSSVLRWGERQ
jgi:rfaE bifunctional protein kinase chain/domain